MIESMTGFGRGFAQDEDLSVTVEIRSVNNRFCEVSARLPGSLAAFESDVQSLVRRELSRGKINVSIQVAYVDEDSLPLEVNVDAARAYGGLLRALRDAAGITAPVDLEHLMKFSDVFVTPEPSPGRSERVWDVVEKGLLLAIGGLKAVRRREGDALQRDLEMRVANIEKELAEVESRAPYRVEEARTRLKERVTQLLGDDRFDSDRLELEIVLFADRADVTEECIRLRSHIDVFRSALGSAEPSGRKLNFLLQEMHREANTIGSKANDAGISHVTVRMKEELERIREQVQNVE